MGTMIPQDGIMGQVTKVHSVKRSGGLVVAADGSRGMDTRVALRHGLGNLADMVHSNLSESAMRRNHPGPVTPGPKAARYYVLSTMTGGEPLSGNVTSAAMVVLGTLMHFGQRSGKATKLVPRNGNIHRCPKLHLMVTILLISPPLALSLHYKTALGLEENLPIRTAP